MTQSIKQGRNYLLEGPYSRHAGKTTAAFKAAREAGFPTHFLSVLNSPSEEKLLKNLAGILRAEPNSAVVIDLHGLQKTGSAEIYKALAQVMDEKKIHLKDGSICGADKCTLFLETRDAKKENLPLPLLTRLEIFKVG